MTQLLLGTITVLLVVFTTTLLPHCYREWKTMINTLQAEREVLREMRETFEKASDVRSDESFGESGILGAKYDVEAYRARMQALRESMDDDGLFDWPEPPPEPDDFTGVELEATDG